MRVTLLAPLAALAAVSPAAFAIDYLSADQAARQMFPDADTFEPRTLTLDAAQLRELEARGVKPRSAAWAVRLALRGGQPLGVVVTDDVVGKFELISYAVGLDLDARVRQIEILAYRESHGHEVRLPAWRRQFVGKGPGAAMRVGEDIANISGATLSCQHVTDGVRRIVAIVEQARRGGRLP